MFNAFHSFLGEVQTKVAANVQFFPSNLAPVVQTLDSAIQRLNNRGLEIRNAVSSCRLQLINTCTFLDVVIIKFKFIFIFCKFFS